MQCLLEPASVAIVGASSNPAKLGSRVLANLRAAGFGGRLYPVNPGSAEIQGLPTYPSLDALPETPDLAFLLIPADPSLDALAVCADRDVPVAIVAAGGFGEVGAAGARRLARLADICRDSRVRVCGPNTNGLFNVRAGIPLGWNMSFSQPLPRGDVALIGHSGATLGALATTFLHRPLGLGLSHVVTTGAEADLELSDVLEYLVDDDAVHAFGLLIEGVRDGPRFARALARAAQVGKRIVALKLGRSDRGALAARSHTGRLTGAAEVYDAVFAQHGVVAADSIETFLGALQLVTSQPPPGAGRVLAIAASGGSAELLADRATHHGLPLAVIDDALRVQLPSGGISGSVVGNPVDIGNLAHGASHEEVTILAADPGSDCVLVHIYGSQRDAQTRAFCESAQAFDKLTAAIVGADVGPGTVPILQRFGIPIFDTVDACLGSIAAVVRAGARALPPPAAAAPTWAAPDRTAARTLVQATGDFLAEQATRELLAAYGLPTTRARRAADLPAVHAAAVELDFPVILKAVTSTLTHKADAGLVSGPIWQPAQLAAACAAIRAHAPRSDGMLTISVEEYVVHELEMILGLKDDPTFGPVLLVGLGGVFTEIVADYAIGVLPIDTARAWQVLRRLRAWPVLERADARGTIQLPALIEAMCRLGDVMTDAGGRIAALDVNPVALLGATEGGLRVLDAKAELHPRSAP
jgi:acyl-CoA synthetase (NDP forming)